MVLEYLGTDNTGAPSEQMSDVGIDLYLDDDDDFLSIASAIDTVDFDVRTGCVTSRVLDRIVNSYRGESERIVTINALTKDITQQYLAAIPREHARLVEPDRVENDLITLCAQVIAIQNAKLPKGDTKYATPRVLTPSQIASCMLHLHDIICIPPAKGGFAREYDVLAMYETAGARKGIYTESQEVRHLTARRFNDSIDDKGMKQVDKILRERAPRRSRVMHRDLAAVDNGIFHCGSEDADIVVNGETIHFRAKALHPFDPRLIFMTKSRVNYVKDAPKPVITHPEDGTVWDVESWITDLFIYDTSTASDPAELAEMIEKNQANAGLDELVWEILSAIIRPYVSWGKTSWFYSTVGNNGKGTLCALARNLLGDGAHTSIPLSDFGKDFALEPLLNANAVIVDENDVGLFIDKAANLKAIVTNDVIQINRKYLSSFAFQFYGHMIQCLNELPRMKDRSESNYRRQLFVPFEKSFTGRERKYIKNDYLQRSDVLEYVLWRVLHMTHYELSTPPATDVILDEYREYNDPVRAFWSEFRDQFCWDLLPFTFLYDLYRAWYSRVSTGTPLQVSQFVTSLYGLLDRDPMWHCKDRKAKLRPAQKMNFPEPLIAEYDLKQWMRAGSKPGDPTACRPDLKPNYRGVLRRQSAIAALTPASEIDVEEKAS